MLTTTASPDGSVCQRLTLGREISGEREGVMGCTVFPAYGFMFSLERVAAVSNGLQLQDTHEIEEIYF